VDLSQYGLPKEPMPQEMIAAGVSLVSFSARVILSARRARLSGCCCSCAISSRLPTIIPACGPEKLADRLPTLRLLSRDAASIRDQAELLLPRVAPAATAPVTRGEGERLTRQPVHRQRTAANLRLAGL
jgi:L-seryl-tRNA(Ser) seleniumtransferase